MTVEGRVVDPRHHSYPFALACYNGLRLVVRSPYSHTLSASGPVNGLPCETDPPGSRDRMTLDIKSESQKNNNNNNAAATPECACAGCGKKITDRFFLKAIEMYWHEDCLKCGCCDCRLGEVGSTLYTKANLILCKRDYLRLFGNTGYCSACNKVIPAFEMVMRAKHNVYHLECFACQQCNHRFCVGDRFYLCDNKILCEYDYEERLVFANMAYCPNSIAALKRHLPPPPSPSAGHIGMNHRGNTSGLHGPNQSGETSARTNNGYPSTSDHQIFDPK